jgi:hypothetical protein
MSGYRERQPLACTSLMAARMAFHQQRYGSATAVVQLAEFCSRMLAPRRCLHSHFPPAERNSGCEPLPQRHSVPGVVWNQDHESEAQGRVGKFPHAPGREPRANP